MMFLNSTRWECDIVAGSSASVNGAVLSQGDGAAMAKFIALVMFDGELPADYLSHLFHTETKERLTHYIQRIRIEGAILALETTALNISEIAYASGFADPAYFARVFKQHKGVAPQEFRTNLDAQRNRRESQPKTVYSDRLDFTHGAPHAPTAAARN